MARIRRACDRIGDAPGSGTAHDDFAPGLRTLGFERRATIAFRVRADRVQIVNVFYGGRDLDRFYRQRRGDVPG